MVNFDKSINRRQTNSYKWDIAENELPMWVADMDFEVANPIIDAMQNRVNHKVFGYQIVPDNFNKSIMKWWEKRHNFSIDSSWILFCSGVVPAISSMIRKLTREGESVIVLSPVYNIFYNSILNNQRKVVTSDLIYKNGNYQIDFVDFEEKIADKNTSMLIFCNPHNPIGKIWNKQTLEKIGKLCMLHDVLIISDEIHCDLTFPEKKYTPFLSLSSDISENIVMCVSASKAFNIAGLQASAIIVKNQKLKKIINRSINTDEIAEPNAFAIDSMVAAFNDGAEWLDALKHYLYNNYITVSNYLEKNIPMLSLIKSDATYLAWIDCSKICDNTEELCLFIRKHTGLILSSGHLFGINGNGFIRLNFATNRELLFQGLQDLKKGIELYLNNCKNGKEKL